MKKDKRDMTPSEIAELAESIKMTAIYIILFIIMFGLGVLAFGVKKLLMALAVVALVTLVFYLACKIALFMDYMMIQAVKLFVNEIPEEV